MAKSKRNGDSPDFGGARIDPMTFKLPADLSKAVNATLKDWEDNAKVSKLWALDSSLWLGKRNKDAADTECYWLGWLNIVAQQLNSLARFEALRDRVRRMNLKHALLMGMGGSSLCPEVLSLTFGRQRGFPELLVLDSTDPVQVKAFADKINLAETLFIVASKSGSTLEPNSFEAFFFDRAQAALGGKKALERFLIITDPGSDMEKRARAKGIAQANIFHGVTNIGGRFSALSNFGLVPAAVMGVDVERFLRRAAAMVQACADTVPAAQNAGVLLGAILGVAQDLGRDKLTLIASPGLHDLGAWLEQLVAESTGKDDKGIIPVDREALAEPTAYGKDRIFVYLRLESAPETAQDKGIEKLERAGQPIVRISVCEPYCLGEEFFRWEIATAVAGAIIGINPFNQPDVVGSKKNTAALIEAYEKTGVLPAQKPPLIEEGGLALYAGHRYAPQLRAAAGTKPSLSAFLKAHLVQLRAGDYFALLAYLEMNEANEKMLQAMRHAVRDKTKAATCLGFGPRFLHSTGQAYKGGPNTGVFLQVTSECAPEAELPVPGTEYSFGILIKAQARGDLDVLSDRGRRALRVHLGTDVKAGLTRLAAALEQALA